MSASPPHFQPMTDDALSEQIAKIDHLLGREEHDAGYSAFVYMRKIWPELRSHASLRSQVSELRAALGDLLGTFKSHVDGRDLLDELHPRHEIDIKVRKDGVERWYEGDWLSNVRDAAKRVRPVLDGALALNSQDRG